MITFNPTTSTSTGKLMTMNTAKHASSGTSTYNMYVIEIINNDDIMLYTHKGNRHRVGGPAVMYKHIDTIGWYVHNKEYYVTKDYCEACNFNEEQTVCYILKYGHNLPIRISELPNDNY